VTPPTRRGIACAMPRRPPPQGGRCTNGQLRVAASESDLPLLTIAKRAAFTAAGLVFAFALYQALALNAQPDFFIYRQGAVLGLRGESPYEPSKIRAAVAEQFPDPDAGPDSFVNNCGYFLPPAAVLLYAPFAVLPWSAAKVAWALVCGVAAFGVTRIPKLFRTASASEASVWEVLVPVLLVVNFLTLAVVQVGQTTLVAVGCVAFGQLCFEKRRPLPGVLLWSVAFVKPHVALPLVLLAWCLGGWKRAVALVAIVAVENVLGAIIAGGSPLFLGEYLDFLAAGHKAVAFNLAERNYEITSWNRLLFVGTKYLIEQTASTTLAGYLIWFGLIIGRCAAANARPSPAWAAAAAAVGSAFVPQVLGYEVLILALVVPWVRELFESGWRTRAGIATLLLAVQLVPFAMFESLGITYHRPLAVALLAVVVLAGPIAPAQNRASNPISKP